MPASFLTLGQWMVIGLLSFWFAATVLVQFTRGTNWKRPGALKNFFPVWSLFSPDPIIADFLLLYRGWREETGFDSWGQIPVLVEHSIGQAVFHPEQYREETLSSLIAHTVDDFVTSSVEESAAYRQLLDYVQTQIDLTGLAGLQIAIFEAGGYRRESEPKILFASPIANL